MSARLGLCQSVPILASQLRPVTAPDGQGRRAVGQLRQLGGGLVPVRSGSPFHRADAPPRVPGEALNGRFHKPDLRTEQAALGVLFGQEPLSSADESQFRLPRVPLSTRMILWLVQGGVSWERGSLNYC